MAIEPLETPFGRKRRINQSSCNKDFSCVEGFCPSFVTVSGAKPRKGQARTFDLDTSTLPAPDVSPVEGSWSILVSGIGGSGVVTVGQTLAVAAHADGYFSSNLDITGLAQKYGAVHSHIKIADRPENMRATRIASQEANSLIGCDLVVAAGDEALSKLMGTSSLAVTDTTVVPTGDFARNPDWMLNGDEQFERLSRVLGERAVAIDAQTLAEEVMGDRLFANMLLVGASWQQGGIPLSHEAIMRAIELNGVAIEKNKQAFEFGRLAFADPERAVGMMHDADPVSLDTAREQTLEDLIAHRTGELVDYRDAAYAKRYADMMDRLRASGLSMTAQKAAARGYFKLLAVKDEWEVARLYARPEFLADLKEAFEGDLKLTFHVGAWPFATTDADTGKVRKKEVGAWLLPVFRLMNRFRRLRGSLLDPFKNTAEAKLARKALADYEADIDFALAHAGDGNMASVEDLLNLPEFIRGYGHVRERHLENVEQQRSALRSRIEGRVDDAKAA
jgi:indolepyruvate ferredoxin oxidoreductase